MNQDDLVLGELLYQKRIGFHCIRIALARQRMNIAPTAAETKYWFRIWRARRKVLRLYENSTEVRMLNTDLNHVRRWNFMVDSEAPPVTPKPRQLANCSCDWTNHCPVHGSRKGWSGED